MSPVAKMPETKVENKSSPAPVSDKVEQEFISASKPKVSSNDFRYSSVSNSTVSTKVRFCPACRQTMPQQNRNPNGQSPENHKERNFSSFRGRRPYYNRGRGSYINHGRFNR
ncbi:hypothetical protein TYRP_020907, partial [Tyrophagus putrescentiae]